MPILHEIFSEGLAYMTGILPSKKYGSHSALNMFWEFSMENPNVLAEYVGFTEDEVKDLCSPYDMDFDECRSWYDGYYFQYAVSLAYYSAKGFYDVIREFPSGMGYADLVFLPRPRHAEKPAIIIELKWNQDAKAAIQQIKEKGYVQALEAYKGRILLVGIAYDKLTRRHVCEIEEYHMDA